MAFVLSSKLILRELRWWLRVAKRLLSPCNVLIQNGYGAHYFDDLNISSRLNTNSGPGGPGPGPRALGPGQIARTAPLTRSLFFPLPLPARGPRGAPGGPRGAPGAPGGPGGPRGPRARGPGPGPSSLAGHPSPSLTPWLEGNFAHLRWRKGTTVRPPDGWRSVGSLYREPEGEL